MNENIRRFILGFIAWLVPFIGSFFLWDKTTNGPSVSYPWFYGWMTVLGGVGLAFAIYRYWKCPMANKDNLSKEKTRKEAIFTGIFWYVELLALDLIFLVGLFGMTLNDYAHLILSYSQVPIITIITGYIKK